jgi:ATP-dependent HslUV protease ATP-binding subunit HslU
MRALTPQEIVQQLDKHIVGQDAAKRAVAVALRNRWRRTQVDAALRNEITPKNILMIGPTGVGKTEIARRLARLVDAPFVKVEATKFTEVGYVGRDVDAIIRDLVEVAIKLAREQATAKVREAAASMAEERLLDILLPQPRGVSAHTEADERGPHTRERFRQMLREGRLSEREVDVELEQPAVGVEIMSPPGMEEMSQQLQSLFQNLGNQRKRERRLKVGEALRLLTEEEAGKRVNEDDIKHAGLQSAEQNGIVFIDEIDKITSRSEGHGPSVSREGVQRDLLPLVEGTTVSTKYGVVRTDHILFICSGAFHLTKPSDLIPELQGRLPNRVELHPLGVADFIRVLAEPAASLTVQYRALMQTEGVDLRFADDGIARIAEVAHRVNQSSEDIGARRLHTVLERLMESLCFTASEEPGRKVVVDALYVDTHLGALLANDDLARYIL